MMKTISLIASFSLIMLIFTGCDGIIDIIPPTNHSVTDNSSEGGSDSQIMAIKEMDKVKLILQTEKKSYSIGEPVPLRFEVINISSEAIEFTFPTGQQFDFLLRNREQVIWRWSYGKQFIQIITKISIEPGQSLIYRVEWPQVDNLGNPVPPGKYKAIALLMVTTPLESPALAIQVEP